MCWVDPELLEEIGRGGMGEVYVATDTQSGETVAVKVLKPEVLEEDPTLLERFEREGQALRRLNHPNIVKMLSNLEENGQHYIIMEYVSGGSLHDAMKETGQMPLERALEIVLDLADALTRAHRLKIIHRDIKPPNVLLTEDGTPKLTDFGVARLDDRSRMTEGSAEAPGVSSPIPAVVAAGDRGAARPVRGQSKVYLELGGRTMVARAVETRSDGEFGEAAGAIILVPGYPVVVPGGGHQIDVAVTVEVAGIYGGCPVCAAGSYGLG